jgi:hypothetical protein
VQRVEQGTGPHLREQGSLEGVILVDEVT